MNLNLNYEGFENFLVERHNSVWGNGVGYKFKFENNYGASVMKHQYSYGSDEDLWELGVIRWRDDEWEMDYFTPITADVVGYLTDEEVRNLLQRIKDL